MRAKNSARQLWLPVAVFVAMALTNYMGRHTYAQEEYPSFLRVDVKWDMVIPVLGVERRAGEDFIRLWLHDQAQALYTSEKPHIRVERAGGLLNKFSLCPTGHGEGKTSGPSSRETRRFHLLLN